MAKSSSVLNLQQAVIAGTRISEAEASTRELRQFLSLGGVSKRLIAAHEVVLIRGESGAHAEVVLRSYERVPTTREASEISQSLSGVLSEPFVGCGGRAGFYADTTFFRLAAITGFEVGDEASVRAWFGTPGPLLLPISFTELQALMDETFAVSVLEPKRDRSKEPTVNPADVYQGDTRQRVYDRINGPSNEFHPSFRR